MSLFSAMQAAVSGTDRFSGETNIIAKNLANVDTNGFKASMGLGTTYVTGKNGGSNYSPGGADLNIRNSVDQQGAISKTGNASDFAVDGDGFAVVRTSLGADGEFLYTRKCDFQTDSEGYLRNSDGLYLYAWRLDADGNIPDTHQDISSLVPVNVSDSQGVVNQTTKVTANMNLDSRTDLGAESVLFTDATSAAEMDTVMGYTALATKDLEITLNGTFLGTVTLTAGTSTLTSVATAIDALGGVSASVVNNKLVINPTSIKDTIEIKESGSDTVTRLFETPTLQQKGFDSNRTTVVYDSLGASREVEFFFKNTNNVGEWNVEVYAKDPSLVTSANGLISQGTFQFDGKGKLTSITGGLNSAVDILWNQPVTGVGTQTVTFEFGLDAAGQPIDGSITQFASPFNVSSFKANGAEFGNRTSIGITTEGIITSSYNNGSLTQDYQIALAKFANPNGLQEVSGNAYRATFDSGEYNLREAGKGGVGNMVGASLEKSNVDLATELTRMITVSKAYQSNTSVMTKTNEMLSNLLNAI